MHGHPTPPLNHMSDLQKKRAQKRFYQKHRDRRIALSKAWKQENRKLYNHYMRNYRAKSKAQPSKPSRDPADY
jgi:NAD-dependent SIR2 family protein deacetylase